MGQYLPSAYENLGFNTLKKKLDYDFVYDCDIDSRTI